MINLTRITHILTAMFAPSPLTPRPPPTTPHRPPMDPEIIDMTIQARALRHGKSVAAQLARFRSEPGHDLSRPPPRPVADHALALPGCVEARTR